MALPPDVTAFAEPALTPELVRRLRSGQRGRRLLLLRAVLDAAPAVERARVRRAWRELEAAEAADPAAVRRVVTHPAVGGWAEACLRHRPGHGRSPWPYLENVAIAAALRAGASLHEIPWRRLDFRWLPTVGVLSWARGGGVRLRPPHWLGLPGGRRIVVEDGDPFRIPASARRGGDVVLAASARPGPREHIRWARVWSEGTALLDRAWPDALGEIGALVGCMVPVVPGRGAETSASSAVSYGAVYASRPGSPERLAAMLVHETAHLRLYAVQDLTALHVPGAVGRFRVPWRDTTRPGAAVLQGATAHLAMAEFWTRLGDRGRAEARRCGEYTALALDQLHGSAVLTPAGRRFVERLGSRLDELKSAEDKMN